MDVHKGLVTRVLAVVAVTVVILVVQGAWVARDVISGVLEVGGSI